MSRTIVRTGAIVVAGLICGCAGPGAESLPRLAPNVFEIAFQGGAIAQANGRELKFEPEPIGRLKCPMDASAPSSRSWFAT